MMEYTLIRSRRKTIALCIHNGAVEVRAPLKMPKSEIDKAIRFKEKWIINKLAEAKERLALRENFKLTYGDAVFYRGQPCIITAQSGNRAGFDENRVCIPADLSAEQIKAVCMQLYYLLAKRDLPAKTYSRAEQMGVQPKAVKINSAKTRWGSCSAKKSINFSWRLIMAEDAVIDYVIVHELAHLIEMNHSARFWSIVNQYLPDFSLRKAKLKELQQKLSKEKWD